MLERNESFRELSVTERVVLFRDFLVGCWPQIDILMGKHEWDVDFGRVFDDWVETCWQLFVGREILGERKGSLTKLSVFVPVSPYMEEPIYSVIAKSKNNEPLTCLKAKAEISDGDDLRVAAFITTVEGGSFGYYPPFDIVTLTRKEGSRVVQYKVELDKLEFHLKKL
ncbi:MAG: hypothetical protein L7U87_08200 [Chlamydiales bacterium]|nr:hypothetical protein [Chlamydiales bacterium]